MGQKSPEGGVSVERRKFERAYFSPDDDVTGVIFVHGQLSQHISGNVSCLSIVEDEIGSGSDIGGSISNLSMGGLYLIVRKDKAVNLEVGSVLTLKEIQVTILNKLDLDIEMQIRRIHEYEFVDHIGLGCEFSNINGESFEVVKQLVEWRLRPDGEDES